MYIYIQKKEINSQVSALFKNGKFRGRGLWLVKKDECDWLMADKDQLKFIRKRHIMGTPFIYWGQKKQLLAWKSCLASNEGIKHQLI